MTGPGEDAARLAAECDALKAALEAQQHETWRKSLEAAAALKRLAAIEDHLQQIESSTIWRVSAPLRAALSSWPLTLRQLSHRLRTGKARAEAPAIALPDLAPCRAMARHGTIAVVLHLYYTELWPEFAAALRSIAAPFDLFVSLSGDAEDGVAQEIRTAFPAARVLRYANRGRDILPFLHLINAGLLFDYELVCKLHSKRSPHRRHGDRWRERLVGDIIGRPETVKRIVGAFQRDADLGIVVGDNQIFGEAERHWSVNMPRVLALGSAIGIDRIPPEARFPGGSIFWIRPFLLRMLAALKLGAADFPPEPLPVDGAMPHAIERLIGLICHDAGMRIEESGFVGLMPAGLEKPARPRRLHLIARYVPPLAPIAQPNLPETERARWAVIEKATPLFDGHRQPRLPADPGIYDAPLREVQAAQAALASRYAIAGFCHDYHWSVARRAAVGSSNPSRETLPDFPFLLCWRGDTSEIAGAAGLEWTADLARELGPWFDDRRSFRWQGRPVLLISGIRAPPQAPGIVAALRAALQAQGVGDLRMIGIGGAAPDFGFDAVCDVPEDDRALPEITAALRGRAPGFRGRVVPYDAVIAAALRRMAGASSSRLSVVATGWDTTPRDPAQGEVCQGATPAKFCRWLRPAVARERRAHPDQDRLILIDAWNDWTAGSVLEPDQDFGRGWLEAVALAARSGLVREPPLEVADRRGDPP